MLIGMGKEVIAIVAEGCPGCEALLSELRKQNAQVRVLDVTKSLEAAKIVRDLGIDRVPTLVTVERTETGATFCTVDEKDPKCVKSSQGSQ